MTPIYSLAALPAFGECGSGSIVATPVASATRLYFYDGRRVRAYDLATGDLVWSSRQLATNIGHIALQLALSGNRLYVGELGTCVSESDPGGFVVALNASTGAQLWQRTVLSPVT